MKEFLLRRLQPSPARPGDTEATPARRPSAATAPPPPLRRARPGCAQPPEAPARSSAMLLRSPLPLLLLAPLARGLDNGLAIKPPMGYNTYMGHTDIMTIANFFVSSGLKHSGYEYVNSVSPPPPPPPSSCPSRCHCSGRGRTRAGSRRRGITQRRKSSPARTSAALTPASRPWSQKCTAWGSRSGSVCPLPRHLPGATLTALLRRADGAASGVTCGNMPGQLYFEDLDAEVTPCEPALGIPFR